MKIYNVIEFSIGECEPEVKVYPFINIENAVNKFNTIADEILAEVKEQYGDSYGVDDDEAEAVYQRDDVRLVCDAWESYRALDWEHSVRVEEKEVE